MPASSALCLPTPSECPLLARHAGYRPCCSCLFLQDSAADEDAAQEAVQLLLSRMRHARHERVLRLRFGLDASPGAPEAAASKVDFGTLGKQLGVRSRSAAAAVLLLWLAPPCCCGGCLLMGSQQVPARLSTASIGSLPIVLPCPILQVSRQRAQQLYHAAISNARSAAAAVGLA